MEYMSGKDAIYDLLEIKGNLIDRKVYALEECGEFIQACMKVKRHKGYEENVIEEAIDCIMAIYGYLIEQEVTDEEITKQIIFKCTRQIERYNKGEL